MIEYIKKQFAKENIFYTIILIVSTIVIVVNRVFVGFSNILWIADIGTFCGILNVINTAKHNVWGLIFNFISSGFIVATSIIQHICLTASITLCISMPMLLIGIINWRKNVKTNHEEKNLKTMSRKNLLLITLLLIAIDAIFTVILYYLNGNIFYLDAGVTSCCLVAIILTSKMYLEQFYFFIIGNAFGIAMYTMLSFQNTNNIPYAFLFLVDFIVVIVGLFNWKRLNNEKKEVQTEVDSSDSLKI